MNVESFAIDGPLLLTPTVHRDQRGSFFESWNARTFAAALGVGEAEAPLFLQDNQSLSRCGVLRGLHYQLPPVPQGKLVRCVVGVVFDVAVDIRRSSPTFGQSVGVHLSAANHRMLWVPPGFAHGFLALSDGAEVLYKVTGLWSQRCERAILWNDPTLAIAWPLEESGLAMPLLAAKDAAASPFAAAEVFP